MDSRATPLAVLVAALAAAAALARRRQAKADADVLWREATSDPGA